MTDPNAELQRRLTAYGRNFGITRLDYATTGQGWWVRLGWRDRNPAFSAVVADSRHGGVRAALREARKIRDRAFLELLESGDILPSSAMEPRPFRTRRNKTGVAGMSRHKTASKTGAGYFWGWKVNWWEQRKAKGRSFADSTYGGPLESFRVAAEFRMVTEFRLYGFSLIDPDGIDALYQKHFGLQPPSPTSDADLEYITVYNSGDYRGARVGNATFRSPNTTATSAKPSRRRGNGGISGGRSSTARGGRPFRERCFLAIWSRLAPTPGISA
jgi:hypothetical protein